MGLSGGETQFNKIPVNIGSINPYVKITNQMQPIKASGLLTNEAGIQATRRIIKTMKQMSRARFPV